MKKTVIALLAAVTVVMSLMASASDAQAQRWRRGGGVAAGVAAGIVGGAVLGAAIAGRPAYAGYYPVTGYVAYPNYYVAAPVGCPGGYWARRPIVDRWGNVVGYSRPRFFCPRY